MAQSVPPPQMSYERGGTVRGTLGNAYVTLLCNALLHYCIAEKKSYAVEEGKFKTVEISASAGKEKEICKAQFYQALADSMRARLLPESESDLRNAVEILNPESWPQDMEVEYGEVELRVLCERFLMSMSEVKQDFRDFKDSGGIAEVGKLKELKNRVNTLPVSTASCERGFSKMNVVCTAYRTRLTMSHMPA